MSRSHFKMKNFQKFWGIEKKEVFYMDIWGKFKYM